MEKIITVKELMKQMQPQLRILKQKISSCYTKECRIGKDVDDIFKNFNIAVMSNVHKLGDGRVVRTNIWFNDNDKKPVFKYITEVDMKQDRESYRNDRKYANFYNKVTFNDKGICEIGYYGTNSTDLRGGTLMRLLSSPDLFDTLITDPVFNKKQIDYLLKVKEVCSNLNELLLCNNTTQLTINPVIVETLQYDVHGDMEDQKNITRGELFQVNNSSSISFGGSGLSIASDINEDMMLMVEHFDVIDKNLDETRKVLEEKDAKVINNKFIIEDKFKEEYSKYNIKQLVGKL